MKLIPIFERGQILKQDMLEALRDNPEAFSNALLAEYGDGVICGCRVSAVDRDHVSISPGILKISGEVYPITETQRHTLADGQNIVYISIECEVVNNGRAIKPVIQQFKEEREDAVELFRYIGGGGVLGEWSCIEDAYTIQRYVVDRRKCPHAVRHGSTVCDEIFELFAKDMLSRDLNDPRDIAFAYQCLNGINDLRLVEAYFNFKGRPNNDELLRMMSEKIRNAGSVVEKPIIQDQKPYAPAKIQVGY